MYCKDLCTITCIHLLLITAVLMHTSQTHSPICSGGLGLTYIIKASTNVWKMAATSYKERTNLGVVRLFPR